MAQIQRHHRAIAACLLGMLALVCEPAFAEDRSSNSGTDLYDRPTLAIDPGMHTAGIRSQAVDGAGRFAVTGGPDGTVRVWSVAEGKLLRTIWIPVGPGNVGRINAVAISTDGSTIAVGGWMESLGGPTLIYLFDRDSGRLIQRLGRDLPQPVKYLTFSPSGRHLVATLGGSEGLRVFDRDRGWSEVFRDSQYGSDSYGAAFTRDGRLATTSLDASIRLYRYEPTKSVPNFRRVIEVQAQSGRLPYGLAFSHDGKRLAVGYADAAAVDVLDGDTLEREGGQSPAGTRPYPTGFAQVAWSADGRTLFATGGVNDERMRRVVLAWDHSGLGEERRTTFCGSNSSSGVNALPAGPILVSSADPCIGLMDAKGEPIWTISSPILSFRGLPDALRVSPDAAVVDFAYRGSPKSFLRFDVRSLMISRPPSNDRLTDAPSREHLTVDGWLYGTNPTLDTRPIHLDPYEFSESLAIAPDAKRFFLGSTFALGAFDDAGAQKWRWLSRTEIWSVNASRDGRIVVAADAGGAIRWHRADDGRELLALQVLPNKESDPSKWDWVLWTPEGFYEATRGAQDVLKWVVNHGPDQAATTLPVSAIAKLHRPNALPHVLDQLETAHALGLDDITEARLEVQAKTGSANPPGGILHVLAIGVDKFGDKAAGLHLNYAAEDAHDVAIALESQKGARGKASLYADVRVTYLPNDKATLAGILNELDKVAQSMAKNDQGQDVAVILVSSHGEMIQGNFYLIPYGFDLASPNAGRTTALSASEFAEKIAAIATHGKVLLLLDACHSGAVGAQAWAKDPDAKILEDAMDMENVTVLTSSKRNELSEELPEWKHGALAQAFLDALKGAADAEGIVKLSALTDAMENEVKSLTKDRQHLGMHVNFNGDLFMAGHY
jgi:WD40 repeat protein